MWAGRHPHAPVAVASRPSYFAELNVVETVLHLLTHEPGFLESQHFRQSLSSDFVALDQTFLVEVRGRIPPSCLLFLAAAASCVMGCCTHVDLTCMTLLSDRPVHVRHQVTDYLHPPCHGSPLLCAAGAVC